MQSSVMDNYERVSAHSYMNYFANKNCIVTGASSGIGRVCALLLMKAGKFKKEQMLS